MDPATSPAKRTAMARPPRLLAMAERVTFAQRGRDKFKGVPRSVGGCGGVQRGSRVTSKTCGGTSVFVLDVNFVSSFGCLREPPASGHPAFS